MRPTRIVVGIVMLASMFGCGGGSGGVTREQASQRSEEIRAEASELFPKLAESVSAISFTGSGTARWKICGMPPSPNGAEYVAELTVDQSNAGTTERRTAVENLLADEGWTADDESSGSATWSKQDSTLTTRIEGGGAFLRLSSGCLDLSGDLIDELTEPGGRDDLGLQPSS